MTSHEIDVRGQQADRRDGSPAPQGHASRPGQGGGNERVLTPEIISLAAVVVLGSIMTILDATIVNIALPTLGRQFQTSISVIQWVPTIYLLAFASVIPLAQPASGITLANASR